MLFTKAMAEEMGGVSAYRASNGTPILGSLMEFYQSTAVTIDKIDIWPEGLTQPAYSSRFAIIIPFYSYTRLRPVKS